MSRLRRAKPRSKARAAIAGDGLSGGADQRRPRAGRREHRLSVRRDGHRACSAAHRHQEHPRHRMLAVIGDRGGSCQGRRHGTAVRNAKAWISAAIAAADRLASATAMGRSTISTILLVAASAPVHASHVQLLPLGCACFASCHMHRVFKLTVPFGFGRADRHGGHSISSGRARRLAGCTRHRERHRAVTGLG